MPDIKKLRELQSLPLELKVEITKQRIMEWVEYYGESNVYISFSGGKDSTVLLNIVRDIFPSIPGVFFDTGLEYPEIRSFVSCFENIEWMKPDMNFKDIIIKYGFPLISKEVSNTISGARKYFEYIIENDKNLKSLGSIQQILESDYLKKVIEKRANEPGARYLAYTLDMMQKDGSVKYNSDISSASYYNIGKYKFLLYSPFEVTSQCCDIMKKKLSHKYISKTKRVPMTGQMAYESELRKQQWVINGCNGFDMSNPRSNPMAFWLEQDVLQYIYNNNIPISSVYGDIISTKNDKTGSTILSTTACSRTGCIFCGFGLHHDKYPNRFELIDIVSNSKLREYVMRGGKFCDDGLWRPSDDGLGYWFVIQYLNIHGKFSIHIPEYEKYEALYGNEQTYQYLYGHLL